MLYVYCKLLVRVRDRARATGILGTVTVHWDHSLPAAVTMPDYNIMRTLGWRIVNDALGIEAGKPLFVTVLSVGGLHHALTTCSQLVM